MSDIGDEDFDFLNLPENSAEKKLVTPPEPEGVFGEGDGLDDFMASTGMQRERDVPDPAKPWMKFHEFKLVQSLAEVEALVDAAIAAKKCSLDLETEGLDNRIFYTPDRKPYTVHQIVGYCISIDGKAGYYIPVRHKPGEGQPDLNVKPIEAVESAIRRLCLAAQPKPKEANPKDPLAFREFETGPQLVIEFWNAKFDQEMLFPVTGLDWWHPESFEDGCLGAFTVNTADAEEGELGLKDKAKSHLSVEETINGKVVRHPYEMIELKELFLKGREIHFDLLSPDEPGVIKYACSDAICTTLLCQRDDLVKLAKAKYGFTYRLEKQVTEVVRHMERNRVKINRQKAQVLHEYHTKKRADLAAQIGALAESRGFYGLDIESPKQLGEFLFGENGLDLKPKPDKNEKSGQYKTDGDTLEGMAKDLGEEAPPILKWIVSYREEAKLLGTYLDKLCNNFDSHVKTLSEMRFNFKQTGAETGRFSAPAQKDKVSHGFAGLPIHGVPNSTAFRALFEAREGYAMVKCDYAGQELRVVANVSGEPVWIKEFLEGTGDLHSITARAFFNKPEVTKEERGKGKIANFALIYGGGAAAIMRATGCDKVEGQRRKQAFDKAVPVFANWLKSQHARVKKEKGVWTPFGRWISIPDATVKEGDVLNGHTLTWQEAKKIQAACERNAVNAPIQGAGADIMKISMVLLHKEFHRRGWLRDGGDDSVRMLLTVHDELVFEIRYDRVAEALPIIVEQMEMPWKMARPPYSPPWQVPLIVEPLIGFNWGAGYKVERYSEKHPIKDTQVVMHGYVYSLTRVCEKENEIQENETIVKANEKDGKKTWTVRLTDPPPWVRDIKDVPPPPTPPSTGAEPPPPASPRPAPAPVSTTPKNGKIATIRLKELTPTSIRQVRGVCAQHIDIDKGTILRLIDPYGELLIDPKLGVMVDPEMVAATLRELHLSDGLYVLNA